MLSNIKQHQHLEEKKYNNGSIIMSQNESLDFISYKLLHVFAFVSALTLLLCLYFKN